MRHCDCHKSMDTESLCGLNTVIGQMSNWFQMNSRRLAEFCCWCCCCNCGCFECMCVWSIPTEKFACKWKQMQNEERTNIAEFQARQFPNSKKLNHQISHNQFSSYLSALLRACSLNNHKSEENYRGFCPHLAGQSMKKHSKLQRNQANQLIFGVIFFVASHLTPSHQRNREIKFNMGKSDSTYIVQWVIPAWCMYWLLFILFVEMFLFLLLLLLFDESCFVCLLDVILWCCFI